MVVGRMTLSIFLQSSVAITFTSIVPLLVFFLLGPLLCTNGKQPIILAALVSLAVGSLLGDVFFHLIPEIFGLTSGYLKNCTFMLAGIFIFFMGERVLQHYHHGHGHSHLGNSPNSDRNFPIITSEVELADLSGLEDVELEIFSEVIESEESGPILRRPQCRNDTLLPGSSIGANQNLSQGEMKPVGLLVLTSDFIHNFVDGIAIGISFATSFPVGVSTSVAVFLHEIPHELGDFAILLAAGYKPMTIVICNILTTLSSFLGVSVALVLIVWNNDGPSAKVDLTVGNSFVTSIKPSILSLTAGNFLYIALADLIPELLHHNNNNNIHKSGGPTHWGDRWIPYVQHVAILTGALIMMIIKIFND